MSTASRSILLSICVAATLRADTTPPPTWAVRPTVAARVGYDDNVFLQDRSTTLPGFVNAVPDRAASWVGRVSVALEATWRASPACQIDAGYSPERVRYEAFDSEDHDNHRFDLSLRGREGAWSHQLKAGLLFVDGAENSPIYGHAGGGPAIGGAGVRARRDQATSKLGGQLTRTFSGGFMRAVGDLYANDFDVRHANTATTPGYANYVDRSEWSAGVEAGHYVRKDFAIVASVRGGEQRQANLLGVSNNYSNTLTRFLIGVEGKPRSDLILRVLGGPDVRHYGNAVAAGFDHNQSARHVEASATWTPRTADTVAFTGKDYLWLSSGGRAAYQHTTANIRWQHTFSPSWSVALTSEVQVGDSRDYLPAATERLDWIYLGTLGLTRSFGPKTKLDLELTREWSDSAIAAKPGREYTHWLASIGVRRTF